MYINRLIENDIIADLKAFPAVAILGPRQCGKSTLAKYLSRQIKDKAVITLDLEMDSDLAKLQNAEWFFRTHTDTLVIIDEIQRRPELFPLIRAIVDDRGGNGHFLILGSASRQLIRQSSESLAGRIIYHQLTPFLYNELTATDIDLETYLLRGGFPRSLLAPNISQSLRWRLAFIRSFIEQDLHFYRNIMPDTMRRLLQMLAFANGQPLNYSKLANALNISPATVLNYCDLLTSTLLANRLNPHLPNKNKRLIKAPKIYLNDSGITTALLDITSTPQLIGHPEIGSIWESAVINHIRAAAPDKTLYFYRTSNGAELDVIIEHRNRILAIECKASPSPKLQRGNYISMSDIGAEKILLAAPVSTPWQADKNITVCPLENIPDEISKFLNPPHPIH